MQEKISKFFATINWSRRKNEKYTDSKYSRAHNWCFDGGLVIPASSSPHIVPLPYSVEENIDPEEAFVASLSSCHMLFFLSIASKRKYVVDTYQDKAIGIMKKNSNGNIYISKVTLRPEIKFYGNRTPDVNEVKEIHHSSHEQCFIANSVKTEVVIEIMPNVGYLTTRL